VPHRHSLPFLLPPAFLLVTLAACAAPGTSRGADVDALVTGLAAADASERAAALEAARTAPPAAVGAIGSLLAHENPDVVRAAALALEQIVHEASRPWLPDESREDRAERRRRVARALLDLAGGGPGGTSPPLPAAERRRVLRFLSLVVSTGEEVRAAAVFLDDPDLQDAALYVLERAPHPEADRVLLERLRRRATPGPAALARVLGNRRSPQAVPALLQLLQDPAAAAAARHALARIGDLQALGPLLAAAQAGEADAATDLFLLADTFLNQRQARQARELQPVWKALATAADPALRCAALQLRARSEGLDCVPVLLDALADEAPAVRGVAREFLTALPGTEVTDRILVTLEEARPPIRARLLEILARRRDPEAPATLRRFFTDPVAEVRLAALEAARLTPDPGLRAALAGILNAPDRSREERRAAAAALLDQAAALEREGLGSDAAELYLLLLDRRELAAPATVAGAMRGLAALGHAEAAARLEALAAEGPHRHEAERALVTLGGVLAARGGERETCERILTRLCTTSPSRSVRQDAARILRRLGVDTTSFAQKAGFLVRWRLDGPHPLPGKGDFAVHPFGDQGPPTADWLEMVTEDLDGVVDLLPRFTKTEQVAAWAWTAFRVDREVDAELRIGSDDGVAVWLDGRLVHQNDVYRGLAVDQDKVPVHLAPGRHTLLLRITQGGGDWRFTVRLTDPDGRPLAFAWVP